MTHSRIIRTAITRADLGAIAEHQFGDMVKAVVDIDRRVMAIGADLHSDEEATLLEDGSAQSALWESICTTAKGAMHSWSTIR